MKEIASGTKAAIFIKSRLFNLAVIVKLINPLLLYYFLRGVNSIRILRPRSRKGKQKYASEYILHVERGTLNLEPPWNIELRTFFCYNGAGGAFEEQKVHSYDYCPHCCLCSRVCLLARTPLLLRSIAIISAPLLGYDLDAESSSFHPFRKVDLKNFTFADTRGKNFLFTASRLTVDTTPKGVFKGDVEKVLLKDAKIRIRLGDKKETETDLSFIKKIPSVRLLTMENGEFTLLFKRSDTQMHLKRIELTVKDFSPEHGGMLSFTGLVSINEPGSSELSAAGKCKGTLQLTGIFPDMLGKGIVELDIEAFTAGKISTKGTKITLPVQFDKGQINILRSNIGIEEFLLMQDGRKAALKKSLIRINARYQTKTGTLSSDNIRIIMPGVGSLNGSARLNLKGAMPVNASLETKDLNFSNLFSLAKSLMTQEEAKKWSIEGQGSLKGRMAGNLSGTSPSLSGTITMDIKKGGFASPDGSKAAQGINGLVIMNFTLPQGEKDASFKVSSRVSSGEYLWGRYYKDLSKDGASFSANADIQTNSKAGSRFKGACDLFNTGRYAYDGHFGKEGWQFHIKARGHGGKEDRFRFLLELSC